MVTVRERVAHAWHAGSDHAADGTPFGGPLCNCDQVAGRMLPMLSKAFTDGAWAGWANYGKSLFDDTAATNPYETGDRHVDQ